MKIIAGDIQSSPSLPRIAELCRRAMTVCKSGHMDMGYLAVTDTGNVTLDEMREIVSALQTKHKNVLKLTICGVSFDPEAMAYLCQQIADNQLGIYWFRFEDIPSGMDFPRLLAAINRSNTVHSVGFENVGLAPAHKKAFTELFKRKFEGLEIEDANGLFEPYAYASGPDGDAYHAIGFAWKATRQQHPKNPAPAVATVIDAINSGPVARSGVSTSAETGDTPTGMLRSLRISATAARKSFSAAMTSAATTVANAGKQAPKATVG